MKITCHACDAKYTIADEKVTGRTVKIKCKKCGATIVVNADTGASQMGGAAAAPYSDPQGALPAAGDDDGLAATRVAGMDGAPPAPTAVEWTVSLSGEEERQMSQLQLAEEMQRGRVTADTYVWRDGMPDWLAVAQVPELASLLSRYAAPMAAAPAPVAAPVVQDENHGLAGTIVMGEGAPSPFAAPRPAAGAPAASTPAPAAAASPLANANPPTAARRANRASGASVDVFAAAQENKEARPERPKPPTPAGRLGERNENSVLFSLSALTATESAAAKPGKEEAIDLGFGSGKSSGGGGGFDDLMNIGGGAIGGPMLAPPPLLAPVVEPPPPAVAPVQASVPPQPMGGMGMSPMIAAPTPQPKSKTGLIIGIVAAVAVLGGVGAVFALGGSKDSGSAQVEASGVTTASAAPVTTASSAPSNTTTSAATDTPAASGAPVASVGSGGDSKPVTGGGSVGSSPSAKASASAAATASAKASAEPAATATSAPTSTDTGAGGGRDFNKGAATTALSAAANAAKGCKQAGGPTGSASVRVVFAPSGNVTSANVQGPPFAGTPVGGCIASAFRGAHVPPFDGSPVAVSKTVNIN
ncbi:MAG: zinc-ribbon domain-containing protein [Polyangiaceae bacterium]